MEFVKRGIICKRIILYSSLKLPLSNQIAQKILSPKRSGFVSAFRNHRRFLGTSFNHVNCFDGNFIIICGFNIDINTNGVEIHKLDKFYNLFDLTN